MAKSTVCENVYKAKGADARNLCQAAHASCGISDKECWHDWRLYEKALIGGYGKSFDNFRIEEVGRTETGTGKASFFTKKNQTIIGISVVAVLIGGIIYFTTRKK